MSRRKLTRSTTDRMVTGVCGGFAEYLDLDSSLVRVGYVLLTVFSAGILGVVAYIVLSVVLPEN